MAEDHVGIARPSDIRTARLVALNIHLMAYCLVRPEPARLPTQHRRRGDATAVDDVRWVLNDVPANAEPAVVSRHGVLGAGAEVLDLVIEVEAANTDSADAGDLAEGEEG